MRLTIATAFLTAPAGTFANPETPQTSPAQPVALNTQRDLLIREVKKPIALIICAAKHPARAGLRSLDYAEADAQGLEASFVNLGYEVVLLKNESATKPIVLEPLKQYEDHQPPKLAFVYIGHGFSKNGRNLLATTGVTLWSLQDALAVSDVEQGLAGIRSAQTFAFYDACRNDPTIAGVRAAPLQAFRPDYRKSLGATGFKTAYATSPMGLSYESAELGHGVFSYYLIRALNGELDNPTPALTFSGVFDLVHRHVSAFRGNSGQHQIPTENGTANGELMIGFLAERPKAPAPAAVAAPPPGRHEPIQSAPEPVTRGAKDEKSPGVPKCDLPITPDVCSGSVWVSFPNTESSFCFLRSAADVVVVLEENCTGKVVGKLQKKGLAFEGLFKHPSCARGLPTRLEFSSTSDAVLSTLRLSIVPRKGRGSPAPTTSCDIPSADGASAAWDVQQLTSKEVFARGTR